MLAVVLSCIIGVKFCVVIVRVDLRLDFPIAAAGILLERSVSQANRGAGAVLRLDSVHNILLIGDILPVARCPNQKVPHGSHGPRSHTKPTLLAWLARPSQGDYLLIVSYIYLENIFSINL